MMTPQTRVMVEKRILTVWEAGLLGRIGVGIKNGTVVPDNADSLNITGGRQVPLYTNSSSATGNRWS